MLLLWPHVLGGGKVQKATQQYNVELLRRWLQGHPSAVCLLGNEAVMSLTVMERLSSRWQQDMTATHGRSKRRTN